MASWDLTEKRTASLSEHVWNWAQSNDTNSNIRVHSLGRTHDLGCREWLDKRVWDMAKVWRSMMKNDEGERRKEVVTRDREGLFCGGHGFSERDF